MSQLSMGLCARSEKSMDVPIGFECDAHPNGTGVGDVGLRVAASDPTTTVRLNRL
jgi:hypothetical protein